MDTLTLGRLEGPNEVGRTAAGRDADKEIAWPGQGLNLPGKDPLEAHVVCPARQHRSVCRERQCSEARPILPLEFPDQFTHKVLTVGCATAVAAHHDFASGP